MNLNLNNITYVIVTFKSEKIIHECINSLPIKPNPPVTKTLCIIFFTIILSLSIVVYLNEFKSRKYYLCYCYI